MSPKEPSDLSTSVERIKIFSYSTLNDFSKVDALKGTPTKCTLIVGVNSFLQGTKGGFFEAHRDSLKPFLCDFEGNLNDIATCFNVGG